MAMYEQQSVVNVEFLKSSRGLGKGRVIKLSHSHQLPPQLMGRVDPVRSRLCLENTKMGFLLLHALPSVCKLRCAVLV